MKVELMTSMPHDHKEPVRKDTCIFRIPAEAYERPDEPLFTLNDLNVLMRCAWASQAADGDSSMYHVPPQKPGEMFFNITEPYRDSGYFGFTWHPRGLVQHKRG